MSAPKQIRLSARFAQGVREFARDVAGGGLVLAHHGLALLGIAVAVAAALILAKPDLRHQTEVRLTAWLAARHTTMAAATVAAPVKTEQPPQVAAKRATAADPQELPREQAQLVMWISRKYQVAPEPVAALVGEAYRAGEASHIDPELILAVMAIESGFNPFAQSTAGAQGLMQVMTRVHDTKYTGYGGNYAAFDPLSNLRVGVWVLRDCIDKAGGSIEGGLHCYVGATYLKTDGGYARKVLAEYARLQQAMGKTVAHKAPLTDAPATAETTASAPAPHPVPDQTARVSPSAAVPFMMAALAKTDP